MRGSKKIYQGGLAQTTILVFLKKGGGPFASREGTAVAKKIQYTTKRRQSATG